MGTSKLKVEVVPGVGFAVRGSDNPTAEEIMEAVEEAVRKGILPRMPEGFREHVERMMNNNHGGVDEQMKAALYRVTVVDVDGNILTDNKAVVAESDEDARFVAGIYDVLKEKGLRPRDVNVSVRREFPVKTREDEDK